ncbi:MAG: hypothetical protein AAFR14_12800, partial [Bacteroidota bacterium]
GGNADENLILQDEALVLNPTHALGFLSLFHPDLIDNIQLYKGDQPAYFGGRLSSVLNVNLRRGDPEEFRVNGGIGMTTSRLAIEGPIQKNKSSFIIGGRISYLDWILDQVKNVNIQRSQASFYDLTAKVHTQIGQKTSLDITGFLSSDDFNFANEVNFAYESQSISATLRHIIDDRWSLHFNTNAGSYDGSLFDIQGNDVSRFTNAISYIRPSIRTYYQLSSAAAVSAGIETNFFSVVPGELAPDSPESTAIPQALQEETAFALTPFIQYDQEISEVLALSLGLRYTTYNRIGSGDVAIYADGLPRTEDNIVSTQAFGDGETIASYSGLEPRAALRLKLGDKKSVKLSVNRSFQYLNQISNTASSTPIDIWQLSDTYIEPQTSINTSLGYFMNGRDDKFQSSLQVFYKHQPTRIEYKDFADLLLNNN